MSPPENCRRRFKRKGQTRGIISESGKVKENGERDAIKGHTATRAKIHSKETVHREEGRNMK